MLLGPLGGSGGVTPQYKNQVRSTTHVPAIQEPKFSVCGIVFDGGCDGRGCGCHIYLALHAQPSHISNLDRRPTPGLFCTNFYNHVRRLRFEKLVRLKLSRSLKLPHSGLLGSAMVVTWPFQKRSGNEFIITTCSSY